MKETVAGVLKEMFRRSKFKVESIAEQLGLTGSSLYKMVEGETPLYMCRAIAISKMLSDSSLLRFFANSMGCEIVKLPEESDGKPEQYRALKKTYQDHSQMVEKYLNAIEDGKVTEEELKEIEESVFRMINASLSLVSSARSIKEKKRTEETDYSPMMRL